MRWASKPGRQLCAGIAACPAELRSGEKNTVAEVGTSEIGTPEVSPDEIGHSQIGIPEVSSDEVRPSQVGAPEIGSSEIGPDEIGSSAVDLVAPGFPSHEFAGAQQQGIDVSSMCCHIYFHDRIGTAVSETFGLVERDTELTVNRAGRLQRQRFDQIPEQLVELSHDRENLEHLLRGMRGTPPVLPGENDLGDLLPCTEAVISGATRKTPSSKIIVNAAVEIRLQMRTGLSSAFVDCKIRRG
jgi:hypothetical protein